MKLSFFSIYKFLFTKHFSTQNLSQTIDVIDENSIFFDLYQFAFYLNFGFFIVDPKFILWEFFGTSSFKTL